MILAEMVHDARIVRLNSEHRPDHVRTWLGDSIAIEGDTRRGTKNFTTRPGLYGADENLHVTERFRRLDDSTLSYFTADNPLVRREPWGGEYPWPATRDKVYEHALLWKRGHNYALGNIMRGARLRQKRCKPQPNRCAENL